MNVLGCLSLIALLPLLVDSANLLGIPKPSSLKNATKALMDKTTATGQTTLNALKNATSTVKDSIVTTEEKTFTDYHRGGHKYATITTKKGTNEIVDCMLVGDREFIGFLIAPSLNTSWSSPVQSLASELPKIEVVNATTEEMNDFVKRCDAIDTSNSTFPTVQQLYGKLKPKQQSLLKYAVIFPGTKWCGAGDVAADYYDLGRNTATDKCCRDHDHSVESMARGEEKNGLKNELLYTMTNCDHDHKFNQCLVEAGTLHASSVGTLFFNVLKTQCYANRKKARCAKQLIKGISPCTAYTYDENSEETWQIFSAEQFVPNRTIPEQKINQLLHAAPGVGDFLSLVA